MMSFLWLNNQETKAQADRENKKYAPVNDKHDLKLARLLQGWGGGGEGGL